MRKLLALGVVAVLLLAVDQGARVLAEGALEDRAAEAVGNAGSAEAAISSWPFLGRVLALGSVRRAHVRVEGAGVGPLRVSALELDAYGVELDRGALLSGDVRVERIDRGVVTVELDGASLTRALDVPVTIDDGRVQVAARGVTGAAEVELGRDGSLALRVAGAGLPALTVPVPRTALNPCAATTVTMEDDRVRLSCEVDEVPRLLRK